MTILYKLTDQNGKTRAGKKNETTWGDGVTHSAAKGKAVLCTRTVIHAYISPEMAVLLNPVHANIDNPILWEAAGRIVVRDGDLIVGVKTLTTIRQIDLPKASATQRVAFAILGTKAICTEPSFVAWADAWLSGADRSAASASATVAVNAAGAAGSWNGKIDI